MRSAATTTRLNDMVNRARVKVSSSSVTRIGACALAVMAACIGPEPKPDAQVGDGGDPGAGGSSGANNGAGASGSNVVPPFCGDGSTQANEECDDGNRIDSDACRNACLRARCGDGVIHVGEEVCDDGNRDDTDRCRNNCQNARCGDGVIQGGVEQCDDGNRNNADACPNSCMQMGRP